MSTKPAPKAPDGVPEGCRVAITSGGAMPTPLATPESLLQGFSTTISHLVCFGTSNSRPDVAGSANRLWTSGSGTVSPFFASEVRKRSGPPLLPDPRREIHRVPRVLGCVGGRGKHSKKHCLRCVGFIFWRINTPAVTTRPENSLQPLEKRHDEPLIRYSHGRLFLRTSRFMEAGNVSEGRCDSSSNPSRALRAWMGKA